ncbi:B-cell scaffold protein with ankyrin repeats-like isoform X2 [Denticeps clupeoides]|nr:B-cell scaffold protein with ankyrin repeats isoform X2 [Denticeps clupeoides]
MSNSVRDLLIIYEAEAEQWASYMRSVLSGPVSEVGICCYDIATVTSRREDFLQLGGYKCKLLILSRSMLEGLCPLRRFFLARVLQPVAHVVVLLCGVDSLAPLLELVPLKGEECLLISSEQDAQEYLSAVAEIVHRGSQSSSPDFRRVTGPELKVQKRSSICSLTNPSMRIIPSRVPCENPGEMHLLLKESVSCNNAEVEFNGNKQKVRVKPVNWNEQTLIVNVPDFPAGSVVVTLYCDGMAKGKDLLEYFSTMGEISRLLSNVADPVQFMCQAFQVGTVEKLDEILAFSLMQQMPTGGFLELQNDQRPGIRAAHSEDIPTLLHFSACHGLRDVAGMLLQCPGVQKALRMANVHGQTPLDIAHTHGHTELYILMQETVNKYRNGGNRDEEVYEKMRKTESPSPAEAQDDEQDMQDEGEDLYAHLGAGDEYDTIMISSNPVAITNRPPAPTPRPENMPTKENSTPYIAQVFQKKKTQPDAETLYSLPTKQAHGQNSISPTYDTFVPSQPPGLEQLIELQERVKQGSLSMDEALDHFSDWQRVQRGSDALQEEKLRQLRASIMSNRQDDDSVYDKISIVHHTPDVAVKECRIGSQPMETDFYSKPIKGQHVSVGWCYSTLYFITRYR